MIVCSCNVFSDAQVRGVLADPEVGPRNVREVYGCLGCAPKCGRCARTIQTLMREAGNACAHAHGADEHAGGELLAAE